LLDIVVFAKANNSKKPEKNLLDIFGQNISNIEVTDLAGLVGYFILKRGAVSS